MRKHVPHDQKLYSWWSYRSANWELANKGRRLDHIWATADVAEHCIGTEIVKALSRLYPAAERPRAGHCPVCGGLRRLSPKESQLSPAFILRRAGSSAPR